MKDRTLKISMIGIVSLMMLCSFNTSFCKNAESIYYDESQVILFGSYDVINPFMSLEKPRFILGSVIIKFKPWVDVSTHEKALTEVNKIIKSDSAFSEALSVEPLLSEEMLALNAERKHDNGLDHWVELRVDKNTFIPEEVRRYNNNENVEVAQLNYIVSLYLDPNDPYYTSYGSWGQDYLDMYGLHLINSSVAWDISTGSHDVIVAVLDTGVDYNHEDINENMWINEDEIPGNGVDDDNDGFIDNIYGADFGSNDSDPMDVHGHGTHCAGTIGAVGNNALGVVGVNWDVKIMAVKAFPNFMLFGGNIATFAEAMCWAVDNGADVISNSWSFGMRIPSIPVIEDAVRYAYDGGCIVVFAAGNSDDNVQYYSPQNMDETITVAAIDHQRIKADFSSWGEKIDVSAPGVDVLSLRANDTDMYGDKIHIVGENYYRASGTSMACPHAAGLAALLLAKNQSQTPDMIKTLIRNTVDEVNSSVYISGSINAGEVLQRTPVIALLHPFANPTDIKGIITINGTACGEHFQYYTLEYARGRYPDVETWTMITNSTIPVQDNVLASLNTIDLEEGVYTIRLQVICNDGMYQDIRWIVVNNHHNTFIVDDDNTNGPWNGTSEYPYQYIQDAIYASGHKDAVFVHNGTYYETIEIERTIDLEGENKHTSIINGRQMGDVVFIAADRVNITGFTITNSTREPCCGINAGIYLTSDFNDIHGNEIVDNFCGILVMDASYNQIYENEFTNNIAGVGLFSFITDVCSNTISDNDLHENNYGIYLSSMPFSTIWYGFLNKDNAIINNTVINSDFGIFLEVYYSKNTISENVIQQNEQGIVLRYHSNNNTVLGNTIIYNNITGILIDDSSNDNTIFENNIIENSNGIYIKDDQYSGPCDNNLLYHNNLINNTQNAYDECNNTWDNGYPSGGNYWDDYMGTDADGDGIGDTPYNISGGSNQDRYPLMEPYSDDTEPPSVEITSPEENFLYIMNRKIMPFFTTLIIGKIDIEVNVSDDQTGIDIVEFYIDDNFKANDAIEPYSWTWDKWAFFKHTIKVTAYDNAGNNASDELIVWKFF